MAHPPGDWDRHTSIQEYDLDDSRATGWCLDITFKSSDPIDEKTDISFMLAGFSRPYYIKESPDEVDTIQYVYGQHIMEVLPSPFGSVVGALQTPDAPIETVSKKIRVGMFLVMGDRNGKPLRTFQVPIAFIVRSFVDFGT